MLAIEVTSGFYMCGQRWSLTDRASGRLLFTGLKSESDANQLKLTMEHIYAAGQHKVALDRMWYVDDKWILAD